MTKASIEERISNYIGERFFSGPKTELTSNLDLLSTGVLDSVSVLQLVDFVEEEFDIQFQAHEVAHENFETIQTLSEFVRQRQ